VSNSRFRFFNSDPRNCQTNLLALPALHAGISLAVGLLVS
jgi:hypothetical protein